MPSKEELYSLYIEQRLTTIQIGKFFSVSDVTIGNWLRRYHIPRRPSGIGLISRGVKPPSPDDLYRFVHEEYRTYEEIAAMYGVDFTAVPHWLDKHGIARPNYTWLDKVDVTLPELVEMYESGLSLEAIGQKYGVGHGTISALFKESNIEVRSDGWAGQRFACEDGHLVRSTYELKVDNWLFAHQIEHEYEPSIPGTGYRADFLANDWYIEIWGVQGVDSYEDRKAEKRAIFERLSLPLVELPAYSFAESRNGLWERKLQICLDSPPNLTEKYHQASFLTLVGAFRLPAK